MQFFDHPNLRISKSIEYQSCSSCNSVATSKFQLILTNRIEVTIFSVTADVAQISCTTLNEF